MEFNKSNLIQYSDSYDILTETMHKGAYYKVYNGTYVIQWENDEYSILFYDKGSELENLINDGYETYGSALSDLWIVLSDHKEETMVYKSTIMLVDDNGSELHSNNLAVWADFWNNTLVTEDIRDWFYYGCAFHIYDSEGYCTEVEPSDMILAFHNYMIHYHNGTGSLFHDIRLSPLFDLELDTCFEAYEALVEIGA